MTQRKVGEVLIDLILPHINTRTLQGNYGCYEIGPVLSGFSTALSSSLRRVLLSSLQGCAISTLQIEGVKHEFQDIPNVKEDVTDIVQNLKKVRLRSYSDHPVPVYLEALGEGNVTAADIKGPATIEVVTPSTHIATLDNRKARLSMKMTVSTGRGFVEAQAQASEPQPIGVILLDAIYSPIIHVNSTIEHTRVGLENLDTIILEIKTDGTISSDDALRQSAHILRQQFSVFRNYWRKEDGPKDPTLSNVLIPRDIYHLPIDALDLSVRSYNILRRNGLTKVGYVLEKDGYDLSMMRNVGEKTLQDLSNCLRNKGFLPEVTE